MEARHAGKRNQRKFMDLLRPFVERCFYCDEPLAFDESTHVDHVLPFSYVGDTEMWNSVLACCECNCRKMDCLPPARYVKDLCGQNAERLPEIKELSDSLARLHYERFGVLAWTIPDNAAEIMRERIGWHYKNAADHGYRTLRHFPCGQ